MNPRLYGYGYGGGYSTFFIAPGSRGRETGNRRMKYCHTCKRTRPAAQVGRKLICVWCRR